MSNLAAMVATLFLLIVGPLARAQTRNRSNSFEAALVIDIRISPDDNNEGDIAGFLQPNSFFDHVIYYTFLDDMEVRRKLKVCVVATFMTSNKTDDALVFSHMLKERTVNEVKHLMNATLVERNLARSRNQTFGSRRDFCPSEFKEHVANGNPEVPILARKEKETNGRASWERNVAELLRQLKLANKTHGMIIVTNHFGKPENDGPWRYAVYDLKDTSAPSWTDENDNVTSYPNFWLGSNRSIDEAWYQTRRRLKRCKYTQKFEPGDCYYYYGGKCRKRNKRTPVPLKGSDPKYCLRGAHYRYGCSSTLCDERCKPYVTWSRCDADYDGKRRKIVKPINDSRLGDVATYLKKCAGDTVEACNVGLGWGLVVVIVGVVLLILLIAGGFATYWILLKRGPTPKQIRGHSSGEMSADEKGPTAAASPIEIPTAAKSKVETLVKKGSFVASSDKSQVKIPAAAQGPISASLRSTASLRKA